MVLSLDGFATSLDGTHDWMFEFFGDDSAEWNLRALEEAGTHAMGRRSYEIMGPHWQASEGPIATSMNEKPKAVFSTTLQRADWGPAEIFGADLPAHLGADRDRRRPQPVRGSRRASEAQGRTRAAVRERRPRADPRCEVMSRGRGATALTRGSSPPG